MPALTLPLSGGLTALARRAAPLALGGFLSWTTTCA